MTGTDSKSDLQFVLVWQHVDCSNPEIRSARCWDVKPPRKKNNLVYLIHCYVFDQFMVDFH